MNNVFNTEKIIERMRELKELPPFEPHQYEMRFTATQRWSTGNDATHHKDETLHFVIRDGEMIFYKPKEK